MKLDLKDHKLIYLLSKDARMSDSALATRIALSKNAVKYRIERLKSEGVIRKFTSTIHLGCIGLDTFTLLLKFNDDIYQNPAIIAYFKDHPLSDWVVTLSGNWDIFVEFVYQDTIDMQNIIKKIQDHFGPLLNTYHTFPSSNVLRVETLVGDFTKGIEMQAFAPKRRQYNLVEVDTADKKILHALCQDSSSSFRNIAQDTDLHVDVVRYRIKQLMLKGVILNFCIDISLPRLGYTEFLVIIKLQNPVAELVKKLQKRISQEESVTYSFFDVMSSSLILACAYRSAEDMDHLTRQFRKEFSSIIADQEFLIIKESIKFNLYPSGLLST